MGKDDMVQDEDSDNLSASHQRVVRICATLSDMTMQERSLVLAWLRKLVEAETAPIPEPPSPRHLYRCVQIPEYPGYKFPGTRAQRHVRNLGFSAKYARAFVEGKLLEMDEHDAHALTLSGFQLAIASLNV